VEYYREKAGHARMRRKGKGGAAQNPQDRPRTFQEEKISNESDPGDTQRITREQRHMTKTSGRLERQSDDDIEGQKMSGEMAAAPGIPLDIILLRLKLFAFQVKSENSSRGPEFSTT
jgi:hypothetical protein